MLKKRLIFTLLFEQGQYQLSRNFRLQEVGDLDWLRENYDFDAIAYYIDELVVLNVSRDGLEVERFATALAELSERYFLPIAAGGGIRSMEDAYLLLRSNADKLVVNTALFKDNSLVRELVSTFVVASLDFQTIGGASKVFTSCGLEDTGFSLFDAVNLVQELGVGELYLTSMERDGTGFGYELDIFDQVIDICSLPIIISGGVGKSEHFVEGMNLSGVSGVSTANIYNFMVDGLKQARSHVVTSGIPMARWKTDLKE